MNCYGEDLLGPFKQRQSPFGLELQVVDQSSLGKGERDADTNEKQTSPQRGACCLYYVSKLKYVSGADFVIYIRVWFVEQECGAET